MKHIYLPLAISLVCALPVSAEEDEALTYSLYENAANNADLYTLDRSVPTTPGLTVAGLSSLEGSGHYMSPDYLIESGVSESGQPTFSVSVRPYWVSPAARNWKVVDCSTKSGELDSNCDPLRAAKRKAMLTRTQLSAGIGAVKENDVTTARAGLGVTFYPFSGGDARLDPRFSACVKGVIKAEVDFAIEIDAHAASHVSTDEVQKAHRRVLEELKLPHEPAGEFEDEFQSAKEIRDAIRSRIRSAGTLAEDKIIQAINVRVEELMATKRNPAGLNANRAQQVTQSYEQCVKRATNRALNKQDLVLGLGVAAKSKDETYQGLAYAGTTAWATWRIPVGARKGEGQSKNGPLGNLYAHGRYIENNSVSVPNAIEGEDPLSLDASTWIGSLSTDYEGDGFVARLGATWTKNEFETNDMADQEFTRLSVAYERKLTDTLWIAFEIGETIDAPSGMDESYSKIAFKIPEGTAGLSSLLGLN